ncbi:MAG: DUF4342 domain-containing protein [Clostridia bacterium]|nr:DUF4342 domain-containing protein [Clostridia bacterium]
MADELERAGEAAGVPDERELLRRIDLLRERTGISYRRAREVLEATGGDVIEALVELESSEPRWRERVGEAASELAGRLRELVRQGNATHVRLRQGERTLFSLPVTAGALGALLWPAAAGYLAAAGMVAKAAGLVEIEIERREPAEP